MLRHFRYFGADMDMVWNSSTQEKEARNIEETMSVKNSDIFDQKRYIHSGKFSHNL